MHIKTIIIILLNYDALLIAKVIMETLSTMAVQKRESAPSDEGGNVS